MTQRNATTGKWHVKVAAVLATAFFSALLAGEASAACFGTPSKGALGVPRLQFGANDGPFAFGGANERPAVSDSLVGLWLTTFLTGDGPDPDSDPDLYDQSFQQFHSDGTEIMISRGLPPALGNVCVGVWEKVGLRTVRLRHTTWNWNPDNTFAGIFVMLVTLRVDAHGNSFAGKWTADNLDPSNNVIPELHAEGIVRATRISVE
jgi:hypothetical protein